MVPIDGQETADQTVLRVGYVVNTYPRPSHTFIRREIAALEGDGVRVHRFAMRRDAVAPTDPADQAEQATTEYVLEAGAARLAAAFVMSVIRHPQALRRALAAGRVGGPGRGRLRQLIYLAEAAHLARRARTLGLDHLHAHFGTNSADVARYAALLSGPGFSLTVHGPEEFDAPAAFSLGAKLSEARFAVAVSSFGRSQLCRWVPAAVWPRLEVVHCGIDPATFADPRPLPDGPSSDRPLRVVAIGRFAEQKGQLLLIEALARCPAPVHLTLVGDGPLAPQIRDTIDRHGLSARVALPGWLDEIQVRDALAAAHALVLPSFAEGLPVVLMEAMAAARPVIATYVAGIPELVVDQETGWLVPAGDADALAFALSKVAATPPARLAQMGLAARSRVLERHDVRTEARKLARLFRRYGKG